MPLRLASIQGGLPEGEESEARCRRDVRKPHLIAPPWTDMESLDQPLARTLGHEIPPGLAQHPLRRDAGQEGEVAP